ncbi:ABC transporter ATP-binding protein [Lactobacillus sp. UMNPBX4]|uniref:ABC transporter ATP-binding protein n=1 Tax=Lactobacillus sp. UMNPBX4 TaxID=2042043 RepID=UPI000BEED81F|nr:ABC transporter ATP-binding protein [Lactobacillus sp. UMNPBX4]PEH05452.1 macrolide ABC transporter ATP-binding protein [Lactobacillus sp. UMNPBX4]
MYQSGDTTIYANKDITFSINKGELVVILGSSGAGKSTLLNILGGMEPNTSGDVIVAGKNIASYNAKQLITYRRNYVGFVFQFYNLIPNLTAKKNVELAAQIVPDAMNPDEALREVDLSDREQNFPAQLSGGEQQRVAIARAIAKKPELLLCDEPTGALDYKTGKQILKILQDMSRKNGSTVLIVTHNAAIAPIADKVIRIRDGSIQKIETNDQPADISSIEW